MPGRRPVNGLPADFEAEIGDANSEMTRPPTEAGPLIVHGFFFS
jgi:hypothetical protein